MPIPAKMARRPQHTVTPDHLTITLIRLRFTIRQLQPDFSQTTSESATVFEIKTFRTYKVVQYPRNIENQ